MESHHRTSFFRLLTVFLFLAVLWGIPVAHICMPDRTISIEERRRLAAFPALSGKTIWNGRFLEAFTTYSLDQFPARETFRRWKAYSVYHIFHQSDNNGVYLLRGHASRLEYPLSEESVRRFCRKINYLREQFFPESRVFVGWIPDKNYYLARPAGYPALDYDRLTEILQSGIPAAVWIDLRNALSLDDYYTTDSHWRQEQLGNVLSVLDSSLSPTVPFPPLSAYTENDAGLWRGVYAGQAALPLAGDTLRYLTNPVTDAAIVRHVEYGEKAVYDFEKRQSADPYEMFLSGASAIVTLENPLFTGEDSLLWFRDSFAGALAPLLLTGYRQISLVDPRYVDAAYLSQYVDFHGQDVLILVSCGIIQASEMWKIPQGTDFSQ